MNITSVVLARSIWLVNALEFNPQGKSFSPIVPVLQNNYEFKKLPSAEENDPTKGIPFKNGDFRTKNNELINVDLTFFSDGIMADTRSSTHDSDDFLDDLLIKITDVMSLPNYKNVIRKKNYLSQLYVTTNKSLEIINPKLKNITKALSVYSLVPMRWDQYHFWPIKALIFSLLIFI